MTQNLNSRGEGKIPTHFGMKDYYSYYSKNYEHEVTRKVYSDVIDDFNKGIVDLMLHKNIDFDFTSLAMTLTIRKNKMVPRLKDGKLVNRVPVDYKATKDLWAINEEAREKKILVRYTNTRTDKYIYGIKIVKKNKSNPNNTYYTFKPCREFQRSLAKRIMDDDLESFDANLLYE